MEASPVRSRQDGRSPPLGACNETQHYPVDFPHISFDAYEHRRLGVREALVHRIMSHVMSPARRPSVQVPGAAEVPPPPPSQGPAAELPLDVRLLADMVHLVPPLGDPRSPGINEGKFDSNALQPPFKRPWTPEAQILDLVQRHYFEVDETATRQWFRIMRPPQGPKQPFVHKPPSPGHLADPSRTVSPGVPTTPRRGTRAAAMHSYHSRIDHSRLHDRGTRVHVDDLDKHRQSLARFAKTQDSMALYDGGAIRPWNYRSLDFKRSITAHQIGMICDKSMAPIWPHSDVLRRFKIRVAWRHRKALRDPLFVEAHPPFEPSRGRSPFRYYADIAWIGEGARRTRGLAYRPRSLSEPPAGMFAHAKLPRPPYHGPVVDMEIAYPRMSLAQLDRRSRRRSLDREHIADMFDAATLDASKRPPLGIPRTERAKVWESFEMYRPEQGIRHLCPSLRPPPRQGTCFSGPWISFHGIWCLRCDLFHMTSTIKGFALNSGPAGARYNKALVGRISCAIQPPSTVVASAEWDDSKIREGRFCPNCTGPDHSQRYCTLRCGHCGALSNYARAKDFQRAHPGRVPPGVPVRYHYADNCQVSQRNRCKCVAFPTFHTAKNCKITCSRPCGNPWPPGHFKHRNAMTCKYRCCMCGVRGHAGQDCLVAPANCLCGGQHLGQDCGWNPQCRVSGCDRYHCLAHCRLCGAGVKRSSPLCEACESVATTGAALGRAKLCLMAWSSLIRTIRSIQAGRHGPVRPGYDLVRKALQRCNAGSLCALCEPIGYQNLPKHGDAELDSILYIFYEAFTGSKVRSFLNWLDPEELSLRTVEIVQTICSYALNRMEQHKPEGDG